jgi:ribonuclease P protein component
MRNTIKNHKDFAMPEDAPIFKCPLFIAKANPAKILNDARYGLIATKRSFRHAVDRNRAKRLLRVWLRANEPRMNPELDYVVIARPAILETVLDTGTDLMKRAIKRLNKEAAAQKEKPAE